MYLNWIVSPIHLPTIVCYSCHALTLQSSCRRSRTAAASFHRRAQSEGPVNRAATSATSAAAATTAATAAAATAATATS